MANESKRRLQRASLIAALLSISVVACSDDPETYVGRHTEAAGEEQPSTPPSAAKPSEAKARITWTGCGISKIAYMTEAAAAYRKQRGVEVIVTGGGATRGIRATAAGRSDLGGSCRHCLPTKSGQESEAILTHVAWDALVFFTHLTNEVSSITLDQAKAILLGQVSNWKELGGADRRIVRVFRRQTRDGKLSGVGYMTRLMVFSDPAIEFTNDALFEHSSGPVERFVEQTEYSFAVTGVSSANKRKVKILQLDGVAPSRGTIASGTYKLFRPLYLVTRGEPTGATKDFVDWIISPDGQSVLSDAGTVTLKEGEKLGALFPHWPQEPGLVRNH